MKTIATVLTKRFGWTEQDIKGLRVRTIDGSPCWSKSRWPWRRSDRGRDHVWFTQLLHPETRLHLSEKPPLNLRMGFKFPVNNTLRFNKRTDPPPLGGWSRVSKVTRWYVLLNEEGPGSWEVSPKEFKYVHHLSLDDL